VTKQQGHPSVSPTKYDEEYFLTACEGYQEYLESEGEHLSRRLSQAFAAADVTPGMLDCESTPMVSTMPARQ
jgi:hypothetical protein